MEYLIFIVIGMILGGGVTYFIVHKEVKPSATFIIDLTDPMKDICKFELEESLETIYSKKQIIVNVKTYGDITLN